MGDLYTDMYRDDYVVVGNDYYGIVRAVQNGASGIEIMGQLNSECETVLNTYGYTLKDGKFSK